MSVPQELTGYLDKLVTKLNEKELKKIIQTLKQDKKRRKSKKKKR